MSSLAGALDPLDAVVDTLSRSQDTMYTPPHEKIEDLDMDPKPELDDNLSVQAPEEELNDLFGEDNDLDLVKHEDATTPASSEHVGHMDDGLSSPERRHREAMEYAEEDEPEHIVEEQVLEASAAIPNIPVPSASDGDISYYTYFLHQFWVIRMPNFIKVDSKPFHPETYVGPEQEEEEAHHAESLREKSMTIKLKVENTVRWRWVKDEYGQDRRQSNSRIVRWSDGSLSLQLGKELFDITQTIDTSGAVPRQALGGTQATQPPPVPSGSMRSQGLTYLVAQHKRAEILQCEALITGYMTLRPTGMQSETHRMLVRAVGQKHNKVARLRMAPDPTTDPEREKMELLKLASRKSKKARTEDDGFGGGRRRRASHARKRTSDDMWSDDEDNPVFGQGGSEDEYGDDAGGTKKAKRRKSGEENSKKGPGEYQTDDFVVADTSEEDDDFGDNDGGRRRKRTRRGRADAEEAEEDDLEKLEAKISQQEAEEKKRRQRVPGGDTVVPEDTGEDAMDVESEEEDEEFGVRRGRTTHGSRKRRAIGFDDDDEEQE
ncbi:RNA polymerase-associated protein LEO1 [Grifola frondosa]|uniref:RNA polymerase-associated protein LEO1 n=1 Tax=Grifola frondosa TaxID=5627 RepID=A0A1C7MBE3_GRIFR|nr:RNA polymerase-associated protein LEO1 [Grifola frondosa]